MGGFLKIRYRTWWIVFLFIQLVLLALMAGSFGALTWVRTENRAKLRNPAWSDTKNNFYEGDSFLGKLSGCIEPCDEKYEILKNEWCDFYDEINDDSYDKEIVNLYQSVCLMYKNLYTGMILFTVFESFSLLSLVFWTCLMCFSMKKISCIFFTFPCSICTFICHLIAFLAYILTVRISFNRDCYKFPDDGSAPDLCAEDGPGLMLLLLVFFPIYGILFWIVAIKIKNKGKHAFDKRLTIVTEKQLPSPNTNRLTNIDQSGLILSNSQKNTISIPKTTITIPKTPMKKIDPNTPEPLS